MSPGQLDVVAVMHHRANTGETTPDTAPQQGTVSDLAMMASMTRV